MEDTKRTGVEIPDAVLKAAVELLERTRLSLEDDMALTRFELRAGDPGPPSQRFVIDVELVEADGMTHDESTVLLANGTCVEQYADGVAQ